MGRLIYISVFLISVIYESTMVENRIINGVLSEKSRDPHGDYKSSNHMKSSTNIISNYLNGIYQKYTEEFEKYVSGFKILINDLSNSIQKKEEKIKDYEYIDMTDFIKLDKMDFVNPTTSQSTKKVSNRNSYDKNKDASRM